ncbi:SDR family oxidoreductase [Pseudomonas sp. LS44]|uniref:SDR family oxidoreductase n=1 Tax=Pseudomonas sp. LS44 TaxID=1357074 RepID=UPI00215A6EF0|nr:SDR family oxidoreductase [Pseudomonas sp. LS44]UVE16747.1 SDR family oxidoreductase [Pseudomonas sp. LS44]
MDAFKENVLAGKVVLVAGGSSGINLGIAEHFARHGAKVALLSRSQDKLDQAVAGISAAGGEALGLSADVRDFAAVDAVLAQVQQRFGNIDVVISGAAGNFVAAAKDMSANGFKTVIDIDLIGTFNVLRAAYPYLNKPGASLISITAPQAVKPAVYQAHVCAAKAGINMLTQCLAMEWGAEGIRVNAISPGPIADTEGMARLAPTPEMEQEVKARLALRDYGSKRDIADVALFLASDNARYITGSIIDCDGGSKLGDATLPELPPRR